MPVRQVADDLLADRDRVVGELGLHVEVDRLFVVFDGFLDVAETNADIAHAVVQPDVGLILFGKLGNGLAVEVQRLPPLFLLLVATGLFLERFDAHAA